MTYRAHIVRTIAISSLLATSIWALSSCSSKHEASEQSTTNTAPSDTGIGSMPSSTPSAPAVTDANIAAIVVAANQADIDNGKQAQLMTKDPTVKAFAKEMITDHTSSNDKAKALASQLNLTPQDDDTSRQMKAQQDSIRTSLKGMKGAAFNKAYIDNEVAVHQTVLDALDNTLIPNAQNPQLKQLLTDTRPVIAQHLDHAKLIQTKLGGTAMK